MKWCQTFSTARHHFPKWNDARLLAATDIIFLDQMTCENEHRQEMPGKNCRIAMIKWNTATISHKTNLEVCEIEASLSHQLGVCSQLLGNLKTAYYKMFRTKPALLKYSKLPGKYCIFHCCMHFALVSINLPVYCVGCHYSSTLPPTNTFGCYVKNLVCPFPNVTLYLNQSLICPERQYN